MVSSLVVLVVPEQSILVVLLVKWIETVHTNSGITEEELLLSLPVPAELVAATLKI
jgi:hypothetical protein